MITGVNNIGQLLKNMGNEHVRNTQSAKRGQENGSGGAVHLSLNNQDVQTEEVEEVKKIEVKQNTTKAFFAVTEDENVVIRIVDSEGKLIRQIPPEEFLKTAEFLQSNNKNILSVEV